MAYQQFLTSNSSTLALLADNAPEANATATEWTFSTTGSSVSVGERAKMIFQTNRPVSAFDANNEPAIEPFNGDAWRTVAMTRAIPAGDWTLNMRLRSTGAAGAPSVRGRWRVFKAKNATDGADAIRLDGGTIIGGETGETPENSNNDTSATWEAPYIELNNEVLIVSFALEARQNRGQTGVGNRIYSLYVGVGSYISAPNIGPIQLVGVHI